MKENGLGTDEELLAVSKWDEERLDRIFRKLLPTTPELHRYALMEGVNIGTPQAKDSRHVRDKRCRCTNRCKGISYQ